MDAIPDDDHIDENMTKEQEELDQHDSIITDLSLRFERLLQTCSSSTESAAHKTASRSLTNRETDCMSSLQPSPGSQERQKKFIW